MTNIKECKPFWDSSCLKITNNLAQYSNDLIDNNIEQWNNNKEEDAFKTRRIQIYPTKEQRVTLKNWFDIARLIYNNTISYIKINGLESYFNLQNKLVTINRKYCQSCNTQDVGKTRNCKTCKSLVESVENQLAINYTTRYCHLHNEYIKENCTQCPNCDTYLEICDNEELKELVLSTPAVIKQYACKAAYLAYKTNFAKMRKQKLTYKFDVRYKKKKDLLTDTIGLSVVNSSCKLDKSGYFSTYKQKFKLFKSMKTHTKKNINNAVLEADPKIQCNFKSNKYYLLLSEKIKLDKYSNKHNTIKSCDPGISNLVTTYNSKHHEYEMFDVDRIKIKKIEKKYQHYNLRK